jgi:hypothetical protein
MLLTHPLKERSVLGAPTPCSLILDKKVQALRNRLLSEASSSICFGISFRQCVHCKSASSCAQGNSV